MEELAILTKPQFDDLTGSVLLREANPVPTPYNNLAWPGFNVVDSRLRILQPKSPNNTISSFYLVQEVQGTNPMITTAGTQTKAFDLLSAYNGCVLSTQEGGIPEPCTLQYNGTLTTGKPVSALCNFQGTVDPALCTFPPTFKGLKCVSVIPVDAELLPQTTIISLDNVAGVTYPA